jgi:hypothetical protein
MSCVISSPSALAHLSLEPTVTNAEALAQLVADAQGRDLQLFHFTCGTYAETALAYAERFRIALFTYDRAGVVTHANAAALTAIITAPDVAPPPPGPDVAPPSAPATTGQLSLTDHQPDLHAWAVSAWQARQDPAPGRPFLAYLPLGVSLLVGLLMLPMVRAWQTGLVATMRVESVVVPVVVFHALCVCGVWRLASWHAQRRRHRLHIIEACTLPDGAGALVRAAMQQSGRGVPQDREALVLLRNEVMKLSGVDVFTAGVLVWEVTIGEARPADRCEWLGAPPGGYPATS